MSKNLEFTLRRFVLVAPEPIIAAAHTKACMLEAPGLAYSYRENEVMCFIVLVWSVSEFLAFRIVPGLRTSFLLHTAPPQQFCVRLEALIFTGLAGAPEETPEGYPVAGCLFP